MHSLPPRSLGKLSVVILFLLCIGLFTAIAVDPVYAQEPGTDVGGSGPQDAQPASMAANRVGNGPVAPPELSDSEFVTDSGFPLDEYLFRYDPRLTNHRLGFDIPIGRYYSPLITEQSMQSNGLLTDTAAKQLIDKKLLPKTATLVLSIYDVDHESPGCAEVDYVFVNNIQIKDPLNNSARLTSGNNRWSTWSISIPIQTLKFPTAAGANGSRPEAKANRIEIEIDALDCGMGQDNWAIEVDWGEIKIASPIRPFVLVHGWTGNKGAFSEKPEGFYNLLQEYGIPSAEPIDYDDGISPSAETAKWVRDEVKQTAAEFGVDKVNLVGHSKGGLFSRQALRDFEETRRQVQTLITLATPNHGVNLLQEEVGKLSCFTKYGSWSLKYKCRDAVDDMDADAMRAANYTTACKQNWFSLPPGEWVNCTPHYFEHLSSIKPDYYAFIAIGDVAVTLWSATYPWMADAKPEPILPNLNEVFAIFAANTHSAIKENRDAFRCVLSYVDENIYDRSNCPLFVAAQVAESTASVAGNSGLLSEDFTLTPGSVHTAGIMLTDSQVTFNAIGTQALTFHLIAPDGRKIDPAAADADPNIDYAVSNPHEIWAYEYTVRSAQAGRWQAVVSSTAQAYASILATAQSTTVLYAGTAQGGYQPGEQVLLQAALLNNTATVPGATITGTLSYSNTALPLTFRDDGANGDATAGDGIYTAALTAPNYRGTVSAEVYARTATLQRLANTAFQVAAQTAELLQVTAERPVDTNANSLIDQLELDVALNVKAAGDYVLSGQLMGSGGEAIVWSTYASRSAGLGSLPPGQHLVTLSFDGQTIRARGLNGPYTLGNVTLRDTSGGDFQVDETQKLHTTASYPATAFEGTALSLTGASDQAQDTDGDGKFDILQIAVNFGVLFPGNYDWNARLVDGDGVEVGWFVGSGYLDNQTPMTFVFDSSRIAANAEDGPYLLRDLSVFQTSGGTTSANIEEVHTTAAYRYLDFEGAIPKVDFGTEGFTVVENEGQVAVTVTLNAILNDAVSIEYVVENGTAQAGQDFTLASGAVTIPAGQTNAQIVFTAHKDNLSEGGETFTIRLNQPSNLLLGRNNPLSITILDFGPASALALAAAPNTIIADGSSNSSVTATVHDIYGNAVVGEPVSFATNLGAIGATAVTDGNGQATVKLTSAPQQGTAKVTAQAGAATSEMQVTFAFPTVSFAAAGYTVNESAGQAAIAVRISAASGLAITVDYKVGGEPARRLTITPKSTTAVINVPIANDATDEPNEVISLVLQSPQYGVLGQPANATLTITDDDPAPMVQFKDKTLEVPENAGSVPVKIELSASSRFTATVECVTDPGAGAPLVVDTVTFAPGATVQQVIVPLPKGGIDSDTKVITMALRRPINATLGVGGSATLTILNVKKYLYLPQVQRQEP